MIVNLRDEGRRAASAPARFNYRGGRGLAPKRTSLLPASPRATDAIRAFLPRSLSFSDPLDDPADFVTGHPLFQGNRAMWGLTSG